VADGVGAGDAAVTTSPRDRYLTVYGRMPVAEALADPSVPVARVLVATTAHGDAIDRILHDARRRGIAVERTSATRVAAVARNGRHHQGVAADIAPPGLTALGPYLANRRGRAHRTSLLLLDGVHNPANVGMIIRSATAAGLDGVVVPHRGTAELGPLVLKASAGVALRATLLRASSATEAVAELVEARFTIVGLDAGAAGARSVFGAELPERAAYVVGNETEGLSDAVRAAVERWLAIPLAGGVESLNVACAATVLAFELTRRRDQAGAGG
jgi:23S rRNA (guanosine2251-2'-O)-methyltransferase